MIGGTSTGGLIAIMLGRLGMTVDECINSYLHLSKEIFGKKKSRLPFNIKLELATQFDSKRLEDIIKKFDGASELLASGPAEAAKCKVVVCAVRKSNSQPAFLRSYPSTNSNDLAQYTTVWEACRATSAAPGFFDSIAVGPNKQELIDGGLGHNNPVETVYAEARDLWGPTDSQLRRRIACLISIGTGVPKSKTLEPGLRQTLKTLSKMVSDTQTTANRFRRDKSELVSNQQYFRFNVDVGLQGIGLEEHQKQAVIADATSTYLDRPDIKDQLVLCAKNLHNQPVRVISQPMKASQPMDSTADTDRVMSLDEKHRVQFSLAGVPFADKFVDRPEEMKAMSSRLLPSHDDNEDSGKRIYVLQGMGGIGKTQLAAAFFTRFGKRFSAAFWLKANTERDLRQSIARCARRIPGRGASENFRKTCADSPEEEQLLVEEVLDWLGRDDNRNWLLVFDNVDLDPELDTDRQAGAYDIVEYLRANHGAILVTTRLQRMTQLGGYEDGGESISSVGPDLGRQIFLKWFGASASEASTSASVEEIESLVGPEFLGGLPLAIAQAAVYMRKTKISLAEYRRRYKDMWLHVMDAAGGRSVVHGYHKSVGTTWSLSLKQVEEREPLAGSLVRMWAFLDHKDLWYGLLREVEDESDLYESFSEGMDRSEWTERYGPMEVPDWLRVLSRDEAKYLGCMEALLDFGLIERIRGPEGDADSTHDDKFESGDFEQSFTMHPVVHMWAMQMQDDTERCLSLRNAVLIFPKTTSQKFSLLERRLPHASICCKWLISLDLRGGHVARNVLFDGLSAQGVHKICWYLNVLDVGLLDRALALLELLEDLVELDMDATQDRQCHRQAPIGFDRPYLRVPWRLRWQFLETHAKMLMHAGQYAESETKFRQALEWSTRQGGESHEGTILTLNHLGMILYEQYKFEESEVILMKVSSVLRTFPAEMRTSGVKAEAARNDWYLGYLYQITWRLHKASQHLGKAIASQENRHRYVHKNAKMDFADVCIWTQRPHEAEALLLEVLESELKTWAFYHFNIRIVKLHLALAYAAQHKEQEASNILDQVFEKCSQARIMSFLRIIYHRTYWLRERGLDDSAMEVVLRRGWNEAFRIARSYDRASLTEEEATTLSSAMRILRYLYARQDRPEYHDLYDQMLLLDPWYFHTGDTDESDGESLVDEDDKVDSEEKTEKGSGNNGQEGAPLEGTNSGDEANETSVVEVPVRSVEQSLHRVR